jgi:alpha-galactosidase
MYEFIAEKIRDVAPDAWVISYTNPMTLCIKTLYRVFPGIKAFGCCHEVFGTQKFLAKVVEEKLNTGPVGREEIKVNPVGVNHFTWLTEARYMEKDLFPLYRDFCLEHKDGYKGDGPVDSNWMNNHFASEEKVKMDLFLRFGVAGAAGDRHLAEFCSGNWYLGSPENVRNWHFSLTPVSWRKKDLKEKLERSKRLVSGEEEPVIGLTGEEGTNQIRAILGLGDLVTNVNIPNQGQIPDLPSGAVVETNAVFSSGSVRPVMAGKLPESIAPMVKRVASVQELLSDGIAKRDLKTVFAAFINDPLVTCSIDDAKALFKEMCFNTRKYLTMYDLSELDML